MRLFKDRHPDAGIVFRRGILEFWIPSKMQAELAAHYNPQHVPAIIYDATIREMGVAVWRCYDGLQGDRFTKEKIWWFPPWNESFN